MPAARIRAVAVERGPLGWQVGVTLDAEGAAAFAELTARTVGQPLAIEVAGEVVSAPVVMEPITGGRFVVSGSFDRAGAERIAAALGRDLPPSPWRRLIGAFGSGPPGPE